MTLPTSHPFRGVFPAITTPFNADGSVDHEFLREHAQWMMSQGCSGMVPLGSLGEGNTLEFDEKVAILKTLVEALGEVVAAGAHPGRVTALLSRDTAPLRASTRPSTRAPDWTVIEVSAITVPTKVVPVPSVAPTEIIVSCSTPKLRCSRPCEPSAPAAASATMRSIGLRRRNCTPSGSEAGSCEPRVGDEDTVKPLESGVVVQPTMAHEATNVDFQATAGVAGGWRPPAQPQREYV